MSESPHESTAKDPAERNMDETADLSSVLGTNPELSMHAKEAPGTALVETPPTAVNAFPVTDKAEHVKPPLTMEEKKKVWTRRIIGAILFFSVLGSLALLAAAQAVTFMFKMILTP